MIKALIFDKDGTLFDFRRSWGAWVEALLPVLTPDAGRQAILSEVLGYDRARGDFLPSSPVIAGTAHEIAECLVPHLPGETVDTLAARMNAGGGRGADDSGGAAAPAVSDLAGAGPYDRSGHQR